MFAQLCAAIGGSQQLPARRSRRQKLEWILTTPPLHRSRWLFFVHSTELGYRCTTSMMNNAAYLQPRRFHARHAVILLDRQLRFFPRSNRIRHRGRYISVVPSIELSGVRCIPSRVYVSYQPFKVDGWLKTSSRLNRLLSAGGYSTRRHEVVNEVWAALGDSAGTYVQ